MNIVYRHEMEVLFPGWKTETLYGNPYAIIEREKDNVNESRQLARK